MEEEGGDGVAVDDVDEDVVVVDGVKHGDEGMFWAAAEGISWEFDFGGFGLFSVAPFLMVGVDLCGGMLEMQEG